MEKLQKGDKKMVEMQFSTNDGFEFYYNEMNDLCRSKYTVVGKNDKTGKYEHIEVCTRMPRIFGGCTKETKGYKHLFHLEPHTLKRENTKSGKTKYGYCPTCNEYYCSLCFYLSENTNDKKTGNKKNKKK